MSGGERPTDLYALTHGALDAVVTAADAIVENLTEDREGPPDLRREAIDPWLLYVLCDELGACMEQLSFPLEELADRAEWLVNEWAEPVAWSSNPDTDRAMELQLERAAGSLRRAAQLAVGAGVATMQPGLQGQVEELEVHVRVPESDPPRGVCVRLGWDHDQFGVRDASVDGPVVHERPLRHVPAGQLAGTIAELAGIDLDTVEGERLAGDLATEARDRLAAMAAQRDSATSESLNNEATVIALASDRVARVGPNIRRMLGNSMCSTRAPAAASAAAARSRAVSNSGLMRLRKAFSLTSTRRSLKATDPGSPSGFAGPEGRWDLGRR